MLCRTWKQKAGLKKGATMKPEYIRLLSIEERAAAMKLGATLKLSEHGMSAKEAAVQLSAGGAAKTIAIAALVGGIPLGIAAHIVGRRLTAQKQKERELQSRIDYYREATRGLEAGLSGAPPA